MVYHYSTRRAALSTRKLLRLKNEFSAEKEVYKRQLLDFDLVGLTIYGDRELAHNLFLLKIF